MSSVQDIWGNMLTSLETESSAISFDVWLKPLEPVDIVDNRLVLLAPSASARDFVASRFLNLLKATLQKHHTMLSEIELIDPLEMEKFSAREQKPKQEEPVATKDAVTLLAKYTFDTFVVGKANQLAFATAQAISEEPGSRYNPLFIYGGVGLGKTHIMHAIGNKIRSTKNLKVMYVPSDAFINDFIAGVRTGSSHSNSFKDKYRSVDVLMIDDVQFFAGKEATQEEFFHTFNDLHQSGKQIVMSSDRPPKEIGGLPDRLRSRFESGIIADIQPPDLETRIAILQRKIQNDKQEVPNEVITYMAERISNNVREMEGALNKLVLLAQLEGVIPSVDLLKTTLKDFDEKSGSAPTMDGILDKVCKYYTLNPNELLGKGRTKDVAHARQLAMYLCTELLSATPLASIGNYFGGRDHTTVMHARDKISKQLASDNKLKFIMSDIKELLTKG
ncbi:MAG: chromosomal replication initiator protein DnaA [Firmicutes bacterium]|nr:chromosomal replication initiator protein DnaA [Bacillota bacterium]